MFENIRSEKDKIRKKILLLRKNLSRREVGKLSGIISKKVLGVKKIKNDSSILIYLPIGNEVDTKFIINLLIQNQKKLFVPAFVEKSWVICQLKNLDDLKINQLKALQPKKILKTNINEIDIAIVPAVAFDKVGLRLGFGKGVYDKLLRNFKGLKIGLAYDFQIVNKLPKEAHDLKMDMVITEKKILSP